MRRQQTGTPTADKLISHAQCVKLRNPYKTSITEHLVQTGKEQSAENVKEQPVKNTMRKTKKQLQDDTLNIKNQRKGKRDIEEEIRST